MGVPKAIGAIANVTRKKIFTPEVSIKSVKELYFDLPSLLHDVFPTGKEMNAETEREYHDRLFLEMERINTRLQPKFLGIFVDGVPTAAKIQQQRLRRFGKDIVSDVSVNTGRRGNIPRTTPIPGEIGSRNQADRNMLTPGTDFMLRLNEAIKVWIQNGKNILPAEVVYSSCLEQGEGEHKLMNFLRARYARDSSAGSRRDSGAKEQANINESSQENQTIVIYGLDTDLFFLTLGMPELREIYLWRRDPRDETTSIINIARSRTLISRALGWNKYNLARIRDFIAVMSFFGNDFIPRTYSLEDFFVTIPEIMNTYADFQTQWRPLTTETTIIWKNMFLFLREISLKEPAFLEQYATVRMKSPLRILRQALNQGSIDFAKYRKSYYERVEAMERRAGNVVTVSVEDMVRNYLEMINYVHYYYQQGDANINKDLYYLYHYSPLIFDLVRSGVGLIADIAEKKVWISGKKHGQNYLDTIQLRVAVLPLTSAYYPISVQNQVGDLIEEDEEWRRLFPSKVTRDIEGQTREDLGPVLVPFFPPRMAREIDLPKKRPRPEPLFVFELGQRDGTGEGGGDEVESEETVF